jgi:hypothetical protein
MRMLYAELLSTATELWEGFVTPSPMIVTQLVGLVIAAFDLTVHAIAKRFPNDLMLIVDDKILLFISRVDNISSFIKLLKKILTHYILDIFYIYWGLRMKIHWLHSRLHHASTHILTLIVWLLLIILWHLHMLILWHLHLLILRAVHWLHLSFRRVVLRLSLVFRVHILATRLLLICFISINCLYLNLSLTHLPKF